MVSVKMYIVNPGQTIKIIFWGKKYRKHREIGPCGPSGGNVKCCCHYGKK
jgi:hypothetical protein